MENAAKEMVELLRAKGQTVSSCESLTAGLFCAKTASIPGASAVLSGGLVTYSNEMKIRLAHVDPHILETDGAVSMACAQAMAQETRKQTGSTYCVSFTGNAGPSAMEGKPAGLVYCAIDRQEGTLCWEFRLDMERNEMRAWLVEEMMRKICALAGQ